MIYVLLLPLVAALIALWPDVPTVLRRLGTSEAASWFQAIGGLATIITTVWLYFKKAADDAVDAKATARAAALAVAGVARDHAADLWKSSFKGDWSAPRIRVFTREGVIAAMDRVTVTQTGDAQFIADYIELQATIDMLFKRCTRYTDSVWEKPYTWDEKKERGTIEALRERMNHLYGYLAGGRPPPGRIDVYGGVELLSIL
jgi:hypothetical protein